mgnify:CR=1 FL=1
MLQALIAHLVEAREVDVSDDLADVGDIMHTRDDIVRDVRLTPCELVAAPLTFVFTSFPSVVVHAGGFSETLACGYRPKLTSSIAALGDSRRSSLEVAALEVSRTRLRQVRSMLSSLGAGWVAWSRR